jgi:hypothetical protein
MARDPELDQPIVAQPGSAEAGKPNVVDEPPATDAYDAGGVDVKYWIACLEDAERAERDWRARGREIIQIYRNENKNVRTGKNSLGTVTFNILFANTEVMLPAVYQKPPAPVVRSRFINVSEPQLPPQQPPPPPGGLEAAPPVPGGEGPAPPPPSAGPPPGPLPPNGGM